VEEKKDIDTNMKLEEVVIIEPTPHLAAPLDHWSIRQHPLVGVPNWTSDAQHEIQCECHECVEYFTQRAVELANSFRTNF